MIDHNRVSWLPACFGTTRGRIVLAIVMALLPLFAFVCPAIAATVSFSIPTSYSVGTTPVSVTVGDFNHDGKPDLAVANSGSSDVSILLGNGDGTFQPAKNYSVGMSPDFIAIGDFNQDHKDDLAVTTAGAPATGQFGGVSVLLGNGDGTFQAAKSLSTDGFPTSVVLGDFDGDGRADLAVTQGPGASANVAVLLGNGDGTFQSAVEYFTQFPANSVAVGDFNGDGNPDLAVATGGLFTQSGYVKSGGDVSILIGNGDGTFQPAVSYGIGADEALSIELADLNADGNPDLAVATTFFIHKDFQTPQYTASVSVLLGNGDGTFQPVSSLDPVNLNFAVFITVGDLTGDGPSDLAVLDRSGSTGSVSLRVLPGNGDGSFQTAVVFDAQTATSLAQADFNDDGAPDLVLTNSLDNSVSVLLNANGAPSFILTVTDAGAGSGTVTSSPLGINCGANCSANFSMATAVTLTAAAAAGSTFAGWGGACTGTGACTVAMNADESVTATFNPGPDFSISPLALSPSSVTAGQSATATVTLSATGGFNSTVSFTCSVQPTLAQAPTCLFNPISSASGTTLTVNTAGPAVARSFPSSLSGLLYAVWLPLIALATGASLRTEQKNKRRVLGFLLCNMLWSGIVLQSACGGNTIVSTHGSGGTPPGTYTISINGTSGSLGHTATVTLTVQ